MKTVALIDTNHGRGHHLTYMRFFCKTLLEMGCKVMAFYPKPNEVNEWVVSECPQHLDQFYAFEMQEFKRRQIPLLGKLPYKFPFLGRPPIPITVLGHWYHAVSIIKKASVEIGNEPDFVFFNWLDNYFSYYLTHHIVDRIFPYQWSGIYFRPGDLRFKKQSFIPHHAIARSPRCQALIMLNEELTEELQDKLKKPVIAFPDLTDESPPDSNIEVIKKIRQKAGKRKIIGLLGSLSKRKGLLTLLEVAQRSKEKNWFFVFAGPLVKEMFHQEYDRRLSEDYGKVKAIVDSAPPNCFFYLEHIAGEPQFNAFIDVCDILFAAYENFPYSSNILTKAAVFRKPVIVSEGFCMAKRVQKFQFGLSIPEGDVSKCIEVLDELCNSYQLSAHQLRFDFEGYRQLHSTKQLSKIFKSILDDSEANLANLE